MGTKKIIVFTIPNDGHLNILKRMVKHYRSSYEFQLVMVDQRNTPPDISDLACRALTPNRSRSFTNTPASHVFRRVYALLDGCLEMAREFDPDLIIYDFCALEGHFVGRALDIPAWCSIPGLVGPFTDTDYLYRSLSSPVNQNAIAAIERKYGLEVRRADVEVISNCLHIPAEVNLLWSYPSITPPTFTNQRKEGPIPIRGLPVRRARPTRRPDR